MRAGRHPESDIFLDDITVSRRHVEITPESGGTSLRDVGSLNGTYVNRERIEEVTARPGRRGADRQVQARLPGGWQRVSSRTYLSIGDVLTLLREEFPDVTISKIRFLESQGLVNPERSPSGYRKFFEHDVERLRWVLRQQREHFLPLKVIRDRLADGDLRGGRRPGQRQVGRAGRPRDRVGAGRPPWRPCRRHGAADQGRRGGDGPHPGRRVRRTGRHAGGGPERDGGCRWCADGDASQRRKSRGQHEARRRTSGPRPAAADVGGAPAATRAPPPAPSGPPPAPRPSRCGARADRAHGSGAGRHRRRQARRRPRPPPHGAAHRRPAAGRRARRRRGQPDAAARGVRAAAAARRRRDRHAIVTGASLTAEELCARQRPFGRELAGLQGSG